MPGLCTDLYELGRAASYLRRGIVASGGLDEDAIAELVPLLVQVIVASSVSLRLQRHATPQVQPGQVPGGRRAAPLPVGS